MPKINEVTERINYLKSFLTILFGLIVLITGGLISLYRQNSIDEIFWFGLVIIFIAFLGIVKIMSKIGHYLNKLGDL